MRIAIVGCGGMSTVYLDILKSEPDTRVVGMADITPGQAAKRAQEYAVQDAVTGEDFREVLEKSRPDVVFDLTVPSAHEAVTVEALRRGCHVLGEKPLADGMEQARRMVKAAGESGKIYAVMQNRRYDRNLQRMKAFLETGRIGAVDSVHCDFFVAPRFGGFRAEMDHVLLLDMAVHHFDAARCVTGADAVSVQCHEWNPRSSWYRHGASVSASFQMSDGSVYTYRGSWCADGFPTSWECDWRVIGAEGTVRWDGGAGLSAQVFDGLEGCMGKYADVAIPDRAFPGREGGHPACVKDFLCCVRTGRVPQTVCTDNIRTLAMVFAAIESAETGRSVTVTP